MYIGTVLGDSRDWRYRIVELWHNGYREEKNLSTIFPDSFHALQVDGGSKLLLVDTRNKLYHEMFFPDADPYVLIEEIKERITDIGIVK